jgi:hypothetical protein
LKKDKLGAFVRRQSHLSICLFLYLKVGKDLFNLSAAVSTDLLLPGAIFLTVLDRYHPGQN